MGTKNSPTSDRDCSFSSWCFYVCDKQFAAVTKYFLLIHESHGRTPVKRSGENNEYVHAVQQNLYQALYRTQMSSQIQFP